MTLLSRRKLRTTARRITPLTLAASAVAVLTLCVAPSFAQPPGAQPNNPLNYLQSGNGNQQPGMLPLPPGYRPRTPQPQSQQRPTTTTGVPGARPGSGQVMYFQKPADALIAAGGPGSSVNSPVGEVVQLNAPGRVPVPSGVPDVPVSTLPPPPPPSRYVIPPPAVIVPPAAVGYSAQSEVQLPLDPMPSTSKKQVPPPPPVPDYAIRLPARERIFVVYDDPQLELAIMQILIDDQIDAEDRKKKEAEMALKIATKQEDIDKAKKDIDAAQNKIDDLKLTRKDPFAPRMMQPSTYQFPPLPVVSPPGVQYQAKTSTYPPRQAILEPGYVVHRKLHFEERNAERMGWDLGPMQTLISAGYFWRDVLLLPQSVVSGWCRGAWDTNAGKCLPGSPAPYYIYPLGLTVSGTAFETLSAIGIGFAFFP